MIQLHPFACGYPVFTAQFYEGKPHGMVVAPLSKIS